MLEPEGNTGLAIFIAVIIFVGGIAGGFWYFFYREGKSPFEKSTIVRSTAKPDEGTGGGHRIPGDINDNGTIDNTDVQMVRDNEGCTKDADCWGSVIGKTLSGDNPIYVSDLDMNTDGKVDSTDTDIVFQKKDH